MALTINPDAGSVNASGVLEQLFNAADVGVDVWKKWTQAKTENMATKAAIPSVAQPATLPASVGGLSPQVLVLGGLAVVVLAVVLTRGK